MGWVFVCNFYRFFFCVLMTQKHTRCKMLIQIFNLKWCKNDFRSTVSFCCCCCLFVYLSSKLFLSRASTAPFCILFSPQWTVTDIFFGTATRVIDILVSLNSIESCRLSLKLILTGDPKNISTKLSLKSLLLYLYLRFGDSQRRKKIHSTVEFHWYHESQYMIRQRQNKREKNGKRIINKNTIYAFLFVFIFLIRFAFLFLMLFFSALFPILSFICVCVFVHNKLVCLISQ